MENSKILKKDYLPITQVKQIETILKDFILWYDKPYCKSIEGAREVVSQYLKDSTMEEYS